MKTNMINVFETSQSPVWFIVCLLVFCLCWYLAGVFLRWCDKHYFKNDDYSNHHKPDKYHF
jgi:hypothetical protein